MRLLLQCYPLPILGLSPDWYKSRAYRARAVREPRAVLAEFGTCLDDGVELRVHDSTVRTKTATPAAYTYTTYRQLLHKRRRLRSSLRSDVKNTCACSICAHVCDATRVVCTMRALLHCIR